MTEELWRYVAIINLAIIFGVGVFLDGRHGGDAPRVLRLAARGAGALLVLVAIGVIANVFTTTPPTLGVKVFALGGAAIAGFFLVLAIAAERRPDHYVTR